VEALNTIETRRQPTTIGDLGRHRIPRLVSELRATFDRGKTRPLAWRYAELDALTRLITDNQQAIIDAVGADLGRPALESFAAEIASPLAQIALTRKSLKRWTRPERVPTPIHLQPGVSYRYRDPLGVALIIAPWNYPFETVMGPLIGALSAGNCALVKPSEVSAATSALLARLIPRYLDTDCVRVVEGDAKVATALLDERFDHIFYTGNSAIGRVVMAAAAKHLTPVTLELGGKNPCIVDRDSNLELAARRIAWAKWMNAGQTCVAPDYVLVHEDAHDRFVAALTARLDASYGDDPQRSPDYGRLVNARHHARVARLMGSGKIAVGGQIDAQDNYIAPTVLTDVSPDSPVMAEEVFGPVLPILKIEHTRDAIAFVNARPKPLALYVFSNDKELQEDVLTQTSSGGVAVNHAIMHVTSPNLPFGGVGESGMGAHHGRASFDTFTHTKSVLKKKTSLDPDLAYPPYSAEKMKWLKRLL
jgi:aldehyde dehydrogenase (NAD+)